MDGWMEYKEAKEEKTKKKGRENESRGGFVLKRAERVDWSRAGKKDWEKTKSEKKKKKRIFSKDFE